MFCRWYCHADDDMYINVPVLSQLLKNLTTVEKVYVGAECFGQMTVSSNFKYSKFIPFRRFLASHTW